MVSKLRLKRRTILLLNTHKKLLERQKIPFAKVKLFLRDQQKAFFEKAKLFIEKPLSFRRAFFIKRLHPKKKPSTVKKTSFDLKKSIFSKLRSARKLRIIDWDCIEKILGIRQYNAFFMPENKYVLFQPHNNGFFDEPILYFKKVEGDYVKVIDNGSDFTEIKNLGDILVQIIIIMKEAYKKGIPIYSFSAFVLELPKDAGRNYHGTAKLALCESKMEFKNISRLQNAFLDHFLAWNYGDVIRSNPKLEKMVLAFHNMLIKDGKRKFAGNLFRIKSRPKKEYSNIYYDYPEF